MRHYSVAYWIVKVVGKIRFTEAAREIRESREMREMREKIDRKEEILDRTKAKDLAWLISS